MFRVKSGIVMQVYAPFGTVNGPRTVNEGGKNFTDLDPWKPSSLTEDAILEKESVYDAVALYNRPETVPSWTKSHIEQGRTVFNHLGAWYSIEQDKIEYLD